MIKYTSNYNYCKNNYIVDLNNCKAQFDNSKYMSTVLVLKNILQRGNPTTPSVYLQDKVGAIDYTEENKIYLINDKNSKWNNTIKGDEKNNFYPAKVFFEEILPQELGEYAFITQLILPEARVCDIVETDNEDFKEQQVDFYFPQLKIVFEIDGKQHNEGVQKAKDNERDEFLKSKGVHVARITTTQFNNYFSCKEGYVRKILSRLKTLLSENEEILKYKEFYDNFKVLKNKYYFENKYSKELEYISIIRFQMTILTLLEQGMLPIQGDWNINLCQCDFDFDGEVALKDLTLWLKNLFNLRNIQFDEPIVNLKKGLEAINTKIGVKIDFSIFKRWNDEVFNNIITVRTDYYDDKDYFIISTSDPIRYKLIIDGEEENLSSLKFLLKNIFGYDDFNDGQLLIIANALELKDTIGLLPTGGGKSLCYQLTCILQPCINFVVVPIKSLMYDQKINLDKRFISRTNYISGDQDTKEKNKVLKELGEGRYFYTWISPERFQIKSFREELRKINIEHTVCYAVIDEVHCLSEWGHDFRTSYLHLSSTIRKYCPTTTFLGLTATASVNVLNDIMVEFEVDKSCVKTLTDYTRPELEFNVFNLPESSNVIKFNSLTQVLNNLNNEMDILSLNENKTNCGLIFTIYAGSEVGCYKLSDKINTLEGFNGKVKFYSGECPKLNRKPVMSDKDFDLYKRTVQSDFKENKFPLMVATKAFGMGIDKSNIRYTVHYGIPGSLESLYQEAGRAGRDKKQAQCFLIHSKDNVEAKDLNSIFELDTTVEELNEVLGKYHRSKQADVLRILFLYLSGNTGVDKESEICYTIFKEFVKEKNSIISITTLKNKVSITEKNRYTFANVQKAIYRLSLLGIISDWTISSWGATGRFEVEYNDFNEHKILENLNKYINKYDKEFDGFNLGASKKNLRYKKILDEKYEDIYLKAIKILIQWNYDNVFYNRRQSLKTLIDLCDDYDKKGKEYFKERLESYFKFNDESFLLDHLAQHPEDIEKLFEILFDENNKLKKADELRDIYLSLRRFLESFRYNTALNYLSGILRLIFDEFDEVDGKDRLMSAFDSITKSQNKEIFYVKSIHIAQELKIVNEDNMENLAEILCKYYPEKVEHIYINLQDKVSFNILLKRKISKLEAIRRKLNE